MTTMNSSDDGETKDAWIQSSSLASTMSSVTSRSIDEKDNSSSSSSNNNNNSSKDGANDNTTITCAASRGDNTCNTNYNTKNNHQIVMDLPSKDWTEKYRTTHVDSDIDVKQSNLFASRGAVESGIDITTSEAVGAIETPPLTTTTTTTTIPHTLKADSNTTTTTTTTTTKTTSSTSAVTETPAASSSSSLFPGAAPVRPGNTKNENASTTGTSTPATSATTTTTTTTTTPNTSKDVIYTAEYYANLGASLNGARIERTPPGVDFGRVRKSNNYNDLSSNNMKKNTIMYPPFSRSRPSLVGSGRWPLSRSTSLSKHNNYKNNSNDSVTPMKNVHSMDSFHTSMDMNVFMTPSMDAQMKVIKKEEAKASTTEEPMLAFSSEKAPTTKMIPSEVFTSNHHHHHHHHHHHAGMDMIDETQGIDITVAGPPTPMTKTSTNHTITTTTMTSFAIPMTTRSVVSPTTATTITATTRARTQSPPPPDASEIVKSMDTVSAIMKLADVIKADIITQENDSREHQKQVRKRTRRTCDPEHKKYVQPQPTDVLLGRGGRSNHHVGNREYLDKVGKLRVWYRSSEKNAKTDLSQMLVDWVHNEQKGRFLKLECTMDHGDRWYIVTNVVARRKASQALREHMFPEERKAKKHRIKTTGTTHKNVTT